MTTKPFTLLGLLLIVGLSYAAYSSSLKGGFIWDDDYYVTENAAIKSWSGLKSIWFEPGATDQYYPLVFTTFLIEQQLWGNEPFGYHLVNLVLHILNALLLWLLLRELKVPGAWLAGLLFALHPVHVESVAWITERKNTLSGFFYLSSLWAYLRYSSGFTQTPPPYTSPSGRFYFLSLFLFMAALFSKTVTTTLPVIVLLLIWWRRGELKKKNFFNLTPFFIVGGILSYGTVWIEQNIVGAQSIDLGLSIIDRFLVAGRAVSFYLGKLIWPSPLIFSYPRWEINASSLAAYLYPVGVLVLLGVLWAYRKKMGRGAFAAFLFFCVTLLPALGFIDVYPMRFSFVADHFQYLASIGIICLISSWVWSFLPSEKIVLRMASRIFCVFAPITLAVLTYCQGFIYKNSETIWLDVLAKNPSSLLAHQNVGVILLGYGEPQKALEHFRLVLEKDPNHFQALAGFGMALINLGAPNEALPYLRKSIRIEPKYTHAYLILAQALENLGQKEEALKIRQAMPAAQ